VSSGGESEEMFQDEESSSQELSEGANNSQEDLNDGSSRKPKEYDDLQRGELDPKKKEVSPIGVDGEELEDNEEPDKIDWQQIFLQEKVMGEPQSIPQSIIYELVNETINKEAFSIQCPESSAGLKAIFQYILFMPLTHTQYITIPSPLSKKNDNFYPLTLVLSIIWIFAFAYIIVWFTYDVTKYLDLQYSFIPMFIYPFGVSIRDFKKFNDFQLALEVFKKELPDQEISLAESYAP